MHGVDLDPWPDLVFPPGYYHRRRDMRDVITEAGSVDLVVHCAAVVGGRTGIEGEPALLAAIDHELDAAMFRWALRARPARFVYLSSSAAYPVAFQSSPVRLREQWLDISDETGVWMEPDQSYGWVKLTGERLAALVREAGVPVTVVRPFSGYGPDQHPDYPFPAFIDRAARRADPFNVWGDGRQVRDFVHVYDIVAAIMAAVELGIDGPFNIGTGRATSLNELAELVCARAGYTPELAHHLGAPVGVAYRCAEVDELHRFYTPSVSLEAGIAEALAARG